MSEAVQWYRKAAEQGDAEAQDNLAFMYKNGQGVTQDYAQAVKWYRKAAEQGYAGAQINLGVMYDNGQGVNRRNHPPARAGRGSVPPSKPPARLGGADLVPCGDSVDESRATCQSETALSTGVRGGETRAGDLGCGVGYYK